jgi:hypothetical protein
VERATLWLNPAVMLALIILMSAWAARQLGAIAGVVVAVAMTCDARINEGFFPSYVDHHGLLTVAVFGLVLGAVVMQAGWRPAGASARRGTVDAAKSGAVFSAVCGAWGMWIGASSVAPAIAIVGVSGLLAIVVQGRSAARQGAGFDAGWWRLWGRVGAGATFVFYLLEYFPNHLGIRLEPNHPFYSLAWLGGGELVAQFGTRWLGPRERRWEQPGGLLLAVLAVSLVPVTFAIGGARVFAVSDPFMSRLHRDYIQEFISLWRTLRGFELRAMFEMLQVGTLPLLAAIVTLLYRRRRAPMVLWFATFTVALLTAMAWSQARWLLNAVGASIVLMVVLLADWTATFRPFARWAIALVILGQFFVPNAMLRYLDFAKEVASRTISRRDAGMALSRDIAAALRESQPQGEIVLLASPNASTGIGYYGRIKTLGTLYWENSDGLKAAASIFGARTLQEAEALIRKRGVTHIAIVSEENFISQYFHLIHPGSSDEEARQCFGLRLMLDHVVPVWLEELPYSKPHDLNGLNTTVMLFKVKR